MERDSAAVARELFELVEARRWDDAAQLLDEDIEVEWPHTCELIRGRDNYVGLNRNYPEPWRITVRSVVASGANAVVEADVAHPAGVATVAASFVVRGGRIVRGREYWVEAGSEEPPAWRSEWVQRVPVPVGLANA